MIRRSIYILTILFCYACGNQTTPGQVSTPFVAPTVPDTSFESDSSIWILPPESQESDAYMEELRKHSPNDNYLLVFDEDVDDVHDMEIYIEDY